MEGFLLIDKPTGPTSHDAVNRIRRLTGEKRVGHAGTLDPFASGLLIVGVGRKATREFSKLVGLDKSYEAEFVLGAKSDTDDKTGKVEKVVEEFEEFKEFKKMEIDRAMKQFVGEIEQKPPAYAAIKVGGVKMYEAARRGQPIAAKPRSVRVDRFDLVEGPTKNPDGTMAIKVKIDCSSGTYIRALARDLGEALGTGGYVKELRRTRIGLFAVKDATGLDQLNKDNVERKMAKIEEIISP